MRYFSSIIFLGLFLVFLSCDKDTISDQQTDKFVKFYGKGLSDNGVRVIATADGYFVLGNIDNDIRGKDICLIPTDKFGNSSGTMLTYGGASDDEAFAIAANDSGYIIAGSTQRPGSSDKDAYLIQIDPNGALLWDINFMLDGNDEAYEVIVLENGSIALTGYIEDETGDKDILYIKYSRVDNKTVTKSYGLPSVDEEAYCMAYLGNNLYFFGGYKEANSNGQRSDKLLLLRWNEIAGVGVEINDTEIVGENTVARAMTRGDDGNILIACDVNKDDAESDILLIRMNDAANQSEWTASIGERTVNSVCCLQSSSSSIYLSGTSSNISSTSSDESNIRGDMMIAKTDLSGHNPVYSYCGDGENYIGAGFDFAPSGGYIITGANFVTDKSLITLFKIDAKGSF